MGTAYEQYCDAVNAFKELLSACGISFSIDADYVDESVLDGSSKISLIDYLTEEGD